MPELIDHKLYVESLGNGLGLLSAFTCEEPRLTIAQAAMKCGLNRATARRYLLTLMSAGYLETDGKRYWVTAKVLRLSASFLHCDPLIAHAQTHLQALTNEIGLLAFLAIRDEHHVMYAAKSISTKVTTRGFAIGARLPLFSTSAGMAIAAGMSNKELNAALAFYECIQYATLNKANVADLYRQVLLVRDQGYSVSEGQYINGIRGIAVPLVNQDTESVVGAISVNMFMKSESAEQSVERLLPSIQAAAISIQGIYAGR